MPCEKKPTWLGLGVFLSGRICVQPSRKISHSSQHRLHGGAEHFLVRGLAVSPILSQAEEHLRQAPARPEQ